MSIKQTSVYLCRTSKSELGELRELGESRESIFSLYCLDFSTIFITNSYPIVIYTYLHSRNAKRVCHYDVNCKNVLLLFVGEEMCGRVSWEQQKRSQKRAFGLFFSAAAVCCDDFSRLWTSLYYCLFFALYI